MYRRLAVRSGLKGQTALQEQEVNVMGIGIALGVVAGILLDNLGIGIALGVAVGAALESRNKQS